MHELRLFETTPVAISCMANLVAGQGWHLQIARRLDGDPWGEAAWIHYDQLSPTELLQVVEDELLRTFTAATD